MLLQIAHFAALVPVLRFGNDTALSLKSALTTAPKLLGLLVWVSFGGAVPDCEIRLRVNSRILSHLGEIKHMFSSRSLPDSLYSR